jgi:hypothetical protein
VMIWIFSFNTFNLVHLKAQEIIFVFVFFFFLGGGGGLVIKDTTIPHLRMYFGLSSFAT